MRLKITAILCAAMLLMTGCGTSEQVHDKRYVRAAAISGIDEKNLFLTFYSDDGKTFTESGESLDALMERAELKLGKSVFTGHTELVILGECDYASTLKLLLNEWRVSPSCIVAFGGSHTGEVLDKYKAEELADSVKKAVDQGTAPECDIVTVLSGLLSDKKRAETVYIGKNGVEGSAVIENGIV